MAASKYFTLFPCEFWSLENFFSCVTFNANEGDEDHLDKIYHAFYSALGTIKSNSPEIYNKIEKLQQSTKKWFLTPLGGFVLTRVGSVSSVRSQGNFLPGSSLFIGFVLVGVIEFAFL
uniref:Uncharacterized protein n=1 Tax=Rhizophagus irregularis (strain DAOM 181602 / DAOM 197198 / MUCL 43194) TaxID=747089 RepID=U9UP47_RHIID